MICTGGIQYKNWLTLSVSFSWGIQYQGLAGKESQLESAKAFACDSFEKWRELPAFIQPIHESFKLHIQTGPESDCFLNCIADMLKAAPTCPRVLDQFY